MIEKLEKLLADYQGTKSWMLAYAEEAFFAGDKRKEHHYETCARQWDNAIKELQNTIQEIILGEMTDEIME